MTYAERTPDSEDAKSMLHSHTHLVNGGEHLPKKTEFCKYGFLKAWRGDLVP